MRAFRYENAQTPRPKDDDAGSLCVKEILERIVRRVNDPHRSLKTTSCRRTALPSSGKNAAHCQSQKADYQKSHCTREHGLDMLGKPGSP